MKKPKYILEISDQIGSWMNQGTLRISFRELQGMEYLTLHEFFVSGKKQAALVKRIFQDDGQEAILNLRHPDRHLADISEWRIKNTDCKIHVETKMANYKNLIKQVKSGR